MNTSQNPAYRIVAFSDWRSQSFDYLEAAMKDISEIDLFVYGGDDLKRVLEFEPIVKRIINRTKNKKLLFVAGNDDLPHEKEELAQKKWAHDLDSVPFFLGRYVFFGNEGSIDGLGFHQRSEAQVEDHLQKHKKEGNKYFQKKKYFPIIVSHTPPYAVLDSAFRHSSNGLARHIGSKSLRRFLEKYAVPLTICGHVHLFGGQTAKLTNGNEILNIASHDDSSADGRLAIIDLSSSGKTQVSLSSLRQWFSRHEMSRLSQLSWRRFQLLVANGIESINDIQPDNFHRFVLKGGGENLAKIWLEQANLFREEVEVSNKSIIWNNIPRFRIVFPEKMDFLEKKYFVVWDIETDLTQTHIWIIGAYDTKSKEFKQFVNLHNENDLLIQFTDWLKLRKDAQLLSYSGSRLEPRAFIKSLEKYGLVDINNVNGRDIDLCTRLRYGCATTAASLQLKELAAALGFKYRHPNICGMHVGSVFSDFLENGKQPEDLPEILEYNEDDVRSTTHLLEVLISQV